MTYPLGVAAMSIVLEIDPNVVKPGWTPLLILIGLALVMALLFRSMKRQFRRVHTNFPEEVGPDAGTAERGTDPSPSGSVVPGDERTPSR